MKTHDDNGRPFGVDELLSAFWIRLETLDCLADAFTAGDRMKQLPRDVQALVHLAMSLRDDWDSFERALGTQVWELTQQAKGAQRQEHQAAAASEQATATVAPPEPAISDPIQARSDDAALFELLSSVGCSMPSATPTRLCSVCGERFKPSRNTQHRCGDCIAADKRRGAK